MKLLPFHRGSRPRRRGQAMVEFALVLPLLVLLLVMAIDFGRVFFGWVALQNATRIAADYAAGTCRCVAREQSTRAAGAGHLSRCRRRPAGNQLRAAGGGSSRSGLSRRQGHGRPGRRPPRMRVCSDHAPRRLDRRRSVDFAEATFAIQRRDPGTTDADAHAHAKPHAHAVPRTRTARCRRPSPPNTARNLWNASDSDPAPSGQRQLHRPDAEPQPQTARYRATRP